MIRIFDFDGVICDSNKMKTYCLKKAVKKNINQEAANDFEKHHKINGGISRYVKFRRLVEKYKLNEDIYKSMILDAELILKKENLKLKMVDNVGFKLKRFFQMGDKLFIASGGNEDEIIDLCNRWLITKYFQGIFGSPRKKMDICKEIKENNNKYEIRMYGDSKYDYDCASSIGAKFFFISRFADSTNWFRDNMGVKLSSFDEI